MELYKINLTSNTRTNFFSSLGTSFSLVIDGGSVFDGAVIKIKCCSGYYGANENLTEAEKFAKAVYEGSKTELFAIDENSKNRRIDFAFENFNTPMYYTIIAEGGGLNTSIDISNLMRQLEKINL